MTTPSKSNDPSALSIDPNWEVSPHDVKARLDAKADFLLLDCRREDEFDRCRIEGSTLVPLQQLSGHIDDLRQHEDREIIVYCHHGRRSLQATTVLRELGFANVKSMAGGIDAWSDLIDPSVPKY